jgi:D-arabinose 1-dehydrogenase-like Zn-dependent alcohol dehydrogenase
MGADNFYSTSDPKTFEKLEGYFDIIINTVPTAFNLILLVKSFNNSV